MRRPLVAVVDLSGRPFLGCGPGSCADLVERCPGSRAVQVSDVLEQLELARIRGQSVVVTVDCRGGLFGAAADLWAQLHYHRRSGLGVVVDIVGRAASAASMFILAADYIVIAPAGSVAVHRGERPSELPPAADVVPPAKPFRWSCWVTDELGLGNPQDVAIYERGTFATAEQIGTWLKSADLTVFDAKTAVTLGFADEIGDSYRARGVASALARGQAVHSPRREALAALGRGNRAGGAIHTRPRGPASDPPTDLCSSGGRPQQLQTREVPVHRTDEPKQEGQAEPGSKAGDALRCAFRSGARMGARLVARLVDDDVPEPAIPAVQKE